MDTLQYTQRLEEVGLGRHQAEALVEVMDDAMKDNFATKHDLTRVQNELQVEIRLMGQELRHEMKVIELQIRADMQKMESSIRADIQKQYLRLGGLIVVTQTLMYAALKL